MSIQCTVLLACLACAAWGCSLSSPLSTEAQLQQALYHTSCPDIWLQAGGTILLSSTLVVNRTVRIQSSSFTSATLSGQLLAPSSQGSPFSRLLYISGTNLTVGLQDLHLTRCWGGALELSSISSSRVGLQRVTMSANGHNELTGGGLFSGFARRPRGWLELSNCSFYGNRAWRGGAVALFMDSDTVSLKDVLFVNNTAQVEGGALWGWASASREHTASQGSQVHLERCKLTQNVARDDLGLVGAVGGGMHLRLTGINMSVSQSLFEGNMASKVGGGLYSLSGVHTKLVLARSRFVGNGVALPLSGAKPTRAFDGGAWFSQGTALCQQSCQEEQLVARELLFEANQASEGAAVYVLSGSPHLFVNCTWRANLGIPADAYDGFPAGVVSRGAALYSGLLSMNVSIEDSLMQDNVASDSSAIAIRPSIFKGALSLLRSTIRDQASLDRGLLTLKFKYVPQVNLSLIECSVLGAVQVSSSASMLAAASGFPSGIQVKDGGAVVLQRAEPYLATLDYSALCNASDSAEFSTSSGDGVSLCKLAHQFDARGKSKGRLLRVSDGGARPVDPASTPYQLVAYQFKVRPVDGPSALQIFETSEQLAGARLETLEVPPDDQIEQCAASTVSLVCRDEPKGQPLETWSLVLVLVLSVIILGAGLARAFIVYRRWAVPGVGIAGCAGCGCVCYRLFMCDLCSKHKDRFAQSSRVNQQIEELEIAIIRSSDPTQDTDSYLEAIRSSANAHTEESLEAKVAYFGYGLIDHRQDLCLKDTIGHGNFGTVRVAVLRRRGHHPARLVAVKELNSDNSSLDLLNEAKLMQDIPPHDNVVFLFGVTETPFCMVSQLVEDACELQDHVASLCKHLQPQAQLQHTLRMLLDACSGLTHLHEHRVLHCDIAPRNVLVAHSSAVSRDPSKPYALINDFGLARKLEDTASHIVFSGSYDRYLSSPENYDMEAMHGPPGDVFMMACTVWESVSLQWGHFKKFFSEGRGLRSLDIRQVTKPADKRLRTEEKRGILIVYEEVHHYLCTHSLADKLAEQLCDLMTKALQHDPEARPSMPELQELLWRAWKTAVEMGEAGSGGGMKQDTQEYLLPKMGSDPGREDCVVETASPFTTLSI